MKFEAPVLEVIKYKVMDVITSSTETETEAPATTTLPQVIAIGVCI